MEVDEQPDRYVVLDIFVLLLVISQNLPVVLRGLCDPYSPVKLPIMILPMPS
jgi:hypothetical protein